MKIPKWRNDLIGMEVMCRSNEAEPLRHGTVLGFEGDAVKVEGQEEDFIFTGPMLPYSQELWASVGRMDPQTQYQFFCSIRNFCRLL